jgi:TonB-linked SusC/RagA family outer membrane protein
MKLKRLLMYKQKNLLLKIVFTLIVSCWLTNVHSQNITITGKVTDSSTNNGIANASVNVKSNSNIGTITNSNGNFKLTIPQGAVLIISSVNYAPREVQTGSDPYLSIALSPHSSELNEVVVIGYGSRKKKDITGAVSTVSSKDIEKSTSMTPELALQGRAPGVFVESGGGDPQSRPVIRIRGVNTFGYSEPLYVIDGVPVYEGGAGATTGATGDIRSPINIFSLINPDDIASISVLKDASAAAIYGVRASNGVILITTKKGVTGRPRIEAGLSYGIQNVPKTLSVLNTSQYFDLVTEAYNNNPDMNSGAVIPIGTKFGGLYSADSSSYAGNNPTYNWQKELLNKDAPIQNYSVKVSGGTEGLNYYFSGGYAKTESPLKANNLERYSISTNIDAKISKIFSAGITLRLVQENSLENTQGDMPTMASSIPFEPFYDPNDPTGFTPVAAG